MINEGLKCKYHVSQWMSFSPRLMNSIHGSSDIQGRLYVKWGASDSSKHWNFLLFGVFNFLSKSNIKRMNCLPCSQISLQRKQSEYQYPCEVKTYDLGLNKYTEWFKNPHQTINLLQILACALQSDISGTEEVKNRSDLWIKKPRNTGLNKTLSKAYRYYLQMAFHMKDGQSFWIHQLEYGFWGCFCNCSTY